VPGEVLDIRSDPLSSDEFLTADYEDNKN